MSDAMPDYSKLPATVYWETTAAGDLSNNLNRIWWTEGDQSPDLTTREAKLLFYQVQAFGRPEPHLVMTGDPLSRPDLMDLVRFADGQRHRVIVSLCANTRLDEPALQHLKGAGVGEIALAIHGSTSERHDLIFWDTGQFQLVMKAIGWATACGIPVQINTLVSRENKDDLIEIYRLLNRLAIAQWNLVFLVESCPNRNLTEISPAEAETLMTWLQGVSRIAPFPIRTTEAPAYRRIAREKMVALGMSNEQMRAASVHSLYGIRAGNGVVYVSHNGSVYPSAYLPLSAGNVRTESLTSIYRDSDLFKRIRDVTAFDGKCGYCEYRKICGGSRARAYAHTGSPYASDPLCSYEPNRALEPVSA